MLKKIIKIIHLPSSVGGNPQGISKHLNKLGLKSQTWVYNQNYLNYPIDKILSKSNNKLIIEFYKLFALKYIFKFDVIFFNWGSGLYRPFPFIYIKKKQIIKRIFFSTYCFYSNFLSRIEIFIIKLFKKPIFIQYQGDDARQGDYCAKNFEIHFVSRVPKSYYNNFSDELKRKSIKFYSDVATKIYALNPDLLHVLPKSAEFLPYSNIDLEDWTPVYNQIENRPLRIGHAPTNRLVKGTDIIIKAVNMLKKKYDLNFILIEDLKNKEAKEKYKNIDIFIDQLFAGWYGGVAVEVMALGKPVISYIREKDLIYVPKKMRDQLPIINTSPKTVYSTLEKILNTPRNQILYLGKKSRTYVEKWHNPKKIAKRIKKDAVEALSRKS
jgi:hypothetical protein